MKTDVLDPASVFRDLTTCDPVRLDALPHEHGIYALHDHTGAIRYIGITKNDRFGFYGRIHNRHVCGSESRSHKFSHAYNTGRMWRAKKDDRPDAKAAKSLRGLCQTVLPSDVRDRVANALWRAIKTRSGRAGDGPRGMLSWGDKRSFVALSEPRKLVDTLLDELRYSPNMRAAVERQAALHVAT